MRLAHILCKKCATPHIIGSTELLPEDVKMFQPEIKKVGDYCTLVKCDDCGTFDDRYKMRLAWY